MAEITGKKLASVEDLIASIRCSKVEGAVKNQLHYIGYGTCTAANLAFGGPMACPYACIGIGDCATSCPFDAIALTNGLPVVDPDLCVGCGTCVRACPKKIIELIPSKARVWVPCSTKDPGKEVKEICGVGCITCKMCVKVCPAKAVSLKDSVVQIDHAMCIAYGPDCGVICVEKCPRTIFRHYQKGTNSLQELQAAA